MGTGLDPLRFDLKLVNADQERERVRAWGVTIVPTVLVFRRGEQIAAVPNLSRLDQLP